MPCTRISFRLTYPLNEICASLLLLFDCCTRNATWAFVMDNIAPSSNFVYFYEHKKLKNYHRTLKACHSARMWTQSLRICQVIKVSKHFPFKISTIKIKHDFQVTTAFKIKIKTCRHIENVVEVVNSNKLA